MKIFIVIVTWSLLICSSLASVPDPCFPHHHIDTDHCSYGHQKGTEFQSMLSLLRDASHNVELHNFVYNMTMEMSQYLYCIEDPNLLARHLFAGEDIFNVNNVIGKREEHEHEHSYHHDHHYVSEQDLLHSKFRYIVALTKDNYGACLLLLINMFKDTAAAEYYKLHPTIIPDSTTVVMTTPDVTTQSTMVTSDKTVTFPPTDSTTQSPTTTTPAAMDLSTTPATPASCFSCKDLECLTNPTKTQCPDGSLCSVTIQDNAGSRSITRGCSTMSECMMTNVKACDQVDEYQLQDSTMCNYCCATADCNSPSQLLPKTVDRYP